MSGGNVGISIKHHALIDAIEVNSKTNVESAVDLNGLTFTQDQGVDFHAKANRIKHELTKIHRREGFGQHYQYDEQNQRALISKIDVKPSPEKINCHFTAYALQGLSVLCGAQDLLNMAAIEDFQSQEYRDKLQDLWNNFVDDMKKMGDSPETATHESFNRRLAAFNFKIVGTLSVCPGFEAKVSAWTGKSRNIRTQIHGLLEKARLWTQLRFKPTTFVYREVEDDGKVHYTVREPILAKNSGSSLVTSVAKQGSVNRVFFNHHQDVFRQGALVPTQLTDQSSGLIAPRNSWLVTNMERETGVEDAQVKMTSQIATSGVYGFMSSENVQIVHGQVEAGLKALSQEEPSSVVDQRETKKPNSLVTQGSHSRRHTNIKFKKTEATPPEVTTPAMQVVPLSLVTDSVLRGGNTPGKGGGEKGAVQSYQAQHEQSLNFNYVLAPLFQRRALSATVEDTSTKAVIDKILEKLPRSSGGSWSNAFKKFMQTDFDLWGDYPVDDPVELYQAAKRYVDAERDPSRKKTLQALLAWKVLEINQNNKGREPFVTVFDDVLGYAGMSDRPVYHLWQSALSVIIHHSQNVFLQAQCKSGKDRTGLLVVAHQILDRLYTPDDGFTYALSKEETPVLSKELKNVQEGSSTESPRRGSVEYRKNKVGLFERIIQSD